MRIIGVIPARFASTRFPGKPLAAILGRPMIQWVYERALQVPGLERVVVATDDERIAAAVKGFGGEAVMTSGQCASGSDRVWEAVRDMACDIVVNLQGDEPTLDPASVEALLDLMGADPDLELGTLVAPLTLREDFQDPNVVKVALGSAGRCLYFSRSPVPYLRDRAFEAVPIWRHVGIYAFRKKLLEVFAGWPRGTLEAAESLEQLRALERGVLIKAAAVDWPGCAVDRPEDVAAAEAHLIAQGHSR
jgi:3-deoxy-manno-octulosonate cytidylyltransferase (CMP-KDO synthetase)